MYVPSTDAENLLTENVAALNPLTLPQTALTVPFTTALSFGQAPDVIARMTGIVQVTDETQVLDDVLLRAGIAAKASVTAMPRGRFWTGLNASSESELLASLNAPLPKLERGRSGMSSASDATAAPTITNSRRFVVNGKGTNIIERRVLTTIALPYSKDIAADVRLRLYARPVKAPLMVGLTGVDADLTVSPFVRLTVSGTLSARARGAPTTTSTTTTSTTTARPKTNVALQATDAETGIFAELTSQRIIGKATIGGTTVGMQEIRGTSNMVPRLTGGIAQIVFDTDPNKYLQSFLDAESDVTASDATRRISILRCKTVVDLANPVDGHYLYVVDPTSPKVSAEVPRYGGYINLDLAPLLLDDVMVYTFVIVAEDTSGFIITNVDGGFPHRRPAVVYGEEWRSPLQALPGPYYAAIVSVERSGDVVYPVPYFTTTEARRLASDWNTIAAQNEDRAYQFTLEYDDVNQQFQRIEADEDGFLEVTDLIDPIRIGDALLWPLFSYDLLWVFDRSTDEDRLREIIFASSSVTATGKTSRGTV